MDAEVKTALRVNGKIAQLTRARKGHKCTDCGLLIEKGDEYYCIYQGGAGLGNIKFPDRCHQACLDNYLGG